MTQLVDQYGRPIKKQELVKELAGPSLTGIRTIWTDTVASGLTPYSLAEILRSAADGDHYAYLTLAEEMEERELHYGAELGKRKLAVSRLPISVESYSDEQKDKDLADAVRDLVRRPGFRGLLKDALDGLGKGYSVTEIIWDRSGEVWKPLRYEWRDPHFFQFDQIARREIRLRDEQDLMDGLPLEPYKYICHVPKLKSGIPIRGGLARLAAWAFMCKGYTVKDWLAFAEVFGMPFRMGKYHNGATPEDINVLKMAVANLGSDAAAVFPDSMKVELVEAAKGGSQAFYKSLAEYLDDQVSKGVLGQTASSSGTPGKLGDEQLQSDVRDDIRDDDAEQLEETLNRDLVVPFIDLNFGSQENYPELQLRSIEKEDVAALVTALKELVPLGLKVEQSVVRDKIGLPDPAKDAKPEDLLKPPAVASPEPGTTETAANREQCSCPSCATALNRVQGLSSDPADLVAARLGDESMATMDALIAPIAELVATAESLEEIRDRLTETFDGLDAAELGELIGEALMLANVSGRAEVLDEH